MSVHPVLVEHPKWRQYQQEVAEAKADYERVQSQQRETAEEQAALDEAYDGEVMDARAKGRPIPAPPPRVPTDHLVVEHQHAVNAVMMVGRRKKAVLAEVAPDLAPVLHANTAETLRRVREEILPPLRAALAEVSADSRLVRELLAAEDRDRHVMPTRASRVPSPTREVLLWAAEHDVDLLEPEPVVRTEPRIQRVDDGDGRSQRPLGFQRGSTLERSNGLPTGL